jgi:hypothetical protein
MRDVFQIGRAWCGERVGKVCFKKSLLLNFIKKKKKKKKKKEAEAGAKPDAIRVAQNPTREEK